MHSLEQDWPALPLEEWEPTYRTLHMWTQIVGKIGSLSRRWRTISGTLLST